ncbi:hypothetical protein Bca4012_080196 [Brassica carinata]|uniref:Uncharacterized protein n=1 Tax=Brassica carinata TaxID=52824 RepID=A0A8X7NWJ7_BRACI|nr:hypothetical protein Bca52824_091198 [Brassica carinata]
MACWNQHLRGETRRMLLVSSESFINFMILMKLIENNYEYDGDDPLFPWIKTRMLERWLVMYEQTVRKLWQSERYNDNLCYLKVKAFENTCYALHLEFQPKVKTANEIFNLIISRNAKPMKC